MADSWLTTAMDNLAALDAEMGEKASRFGEAGLRETASWREKYLRLKQAVDAGASRREVAELRNTLWDEGVDIVDTRLRRLEQRMGSLRREPYLQEQIGQTIDSRLGKLQQEMAFLQGGSRPDLSDHEVSALLDDMAREEDFLTAAKNKASDIKGRRQPRSGNSFEDLAELLNIEEDLKVDRLGQAASERKSKVLLHPASVEARRETARRALGESTGGELLDTPSLERELNPKGATMADDVPEDLAALRRRIAKQVGGAVEETYKKKAPTKNPFKKVLRRLDQQKLEKKVPGMVRPGHSYYLHTVRTGSPEQAASVLKSIDEEGLFYRHYGGGKAKSVRPFLLGPLGADKEALALDRMAIREGAPRGGTVQGKGTEYMTRADPSTRTYIIELPNDITHVDQIGERITPDHPLYEKVAEAREARSPGKTGDRPLLSQTDPTAGRRSGKVNVNRQAWTGRLPASRIIGHIENGRLTLKPQISEAVKEARVTGIPRGAAVADEPKKPGTPLRQARDQTAELAHNRSVAKTRISFMGTRIDRALENLQAPPARELDHLKPPVTSVNSMGIDALGRSQEEFDKFGRYMDEADRLAFQSKLNEAYDLVTDEMLQKTREQRARAQRQFNHHDPGWASKVEVGREERITGLQNEVADQKKRLSGLNPSSGAARQARERLIVAKRALKGLGRIAGIASTAYEAGRLGGEVGRHGPVEGTKRYAGTLAKELGDLSQLPEKAAEMLPGYGEKGVNLPAAILGAGGRKLSEAGRSLRGEDAPYEAGKAIAEMQARGESLDDSDIGQEIDREVEEAMADEEALRTGPHKGYNPRMIRDESGWTDSRKNRHGAARRALMSKKEREAENL